jgi:hypothetical protein
MEVIRWLVLKWQELKNLTVYWCKYVDMVSINNSVCILSIFWVSQLFNFWYLAYYQYSICFIKCSQLKCYPNCFTLNRHPRRLSLLLSSVIYHGVYVLQSFSSPIKYFEVPRVALFQNIELAIFLFVRFRIRYGPSHTYYVKKKKAKATARVFFYTAT